MRILFLSQILPYPLDSGAKVRAYHIVQTLSARHEVTLVSFSRDSDSPEAIAHLRSVCHAVQLVPLKRSRLNEILNLARSFVTVQPFTILRDHRGDMQQLVIDLMLASSFDAIHADQLSMAQYALLALSAQPDRREASRARPKLVLDAHNAYYLIPQRMASVSRNVLLKKFFQFEAKRVAHYEAQTLPRFDHVLTVTENDLASLKQLGNFAADQPRFTAMPICIDAAAPPIARRANARGLLLVGGLHWPPNADAARWFARKIFPLIIAQVPDVKLIIVGARAPQDILALAHAYPGSIEVTGYVDDVQPFIEESAALMVALRMGGGMRVKIIEALQWSLPIVSTTIGCEGLAVTDQQNILIADEPQAFAAAVIKLLNNQSLAARLAENGRQLIAERYDWRKVYQALDAIYPSAD
jgi:glycosyltransferase involved in cell wall biosynthesis